MSCGVLSSKNPLRLAVAYLAHHAWYDKFVLCCILLSSISLALEAADPKSAVLASRCPASVLDCSGRVPGQVSFPNIAEDYVCPRHQDDPDFGRVYRPCGSDTEAPCCSHRAVYSFLATMDEIFTIIFVVEMGIKLVTDGIVFHRLAYFRNSWNILDSLIVTISVILLVLSQTSEGAGSQVKALKALRAFRVLRPLRVVKLHPKLKTTFLCIISSIPAMMTVGVVLLLYMFVMSMFCVQFFKGQFFRFASGPFFCPFTSFITVSSWSLYELISSSLVFHTFLCGEQVL